MNSQRVRAGRDLEDSLRLLKGRRSRLYKQHTSLQCYYYDDHSLYNHWQYWGQCCLGWSYCTESVLGLVLACATQCHWLLLATDYTMHPSKAYKLSINHLHLSQSSVWVLQVSSQSHQCHCASVPTRLHCCTVHVSEGSPPSFMYLWRPLPYHAHHMSDLYLIHVHS